MRALGQTRPVIMLGSNVSSSAIAAGGIASAAWPVSRWLPTFSGTPPEWPLS